MRACVCVDWAKYLLEEFDCDNDHEKIAVCKDDIHDFCNQCYIIMEFTHQCPD